MMHSIKCSAPIKDQAIVRRACQTGCLAVAMIATMSSSAQFLEYHDALVTPADVRIFGFSPDRHARFGGAPGDVNGDGYDDLLINQGIPAAGRRGIGLYLGSASPSSEMYASASPGLGPVVDLDISQGESSSISNLQPKVGDLNGDQRDDMVFFYPNEFRIVFGRIIWPDSVIHTNGGEADVYIVHPEQGWAMHLGSQKNPADYNGDGINDLNQAHEREFNGQGHNQSGRENVFLGDQSWPYTIDLETTIGDISNFGTASQFVPITVAVVDINKDGYDEKIGVTKIPAVSQGPSYFTIVWGAPNPPANIEYDGDSMPGIFNEPGGGDGFAFGDFTGDGLLDMAIQKSNSTGTHVSLYFDLTKWTPGTGYINSPNVQIIMANSQPGATSGIYTGDFNGDEIADLLLIDHNTRAGLSDSIYDKSVHIFYGKPNWPAVINLASQYADVTIAGIGELIYGTNLGPYGVPPNMVADINGDSIDDIFLNSHGSQSIILGGTDLPSIIRVQNGEVDFVIDNITTLEDGPPFFDFNGDGITDTLFRRGRPFGGAPFQDRTIEILLGRPASEHVYVNRTETIPGDGSAQLPYRQLRLGLKTVKAGGTVYLMDGGTAATISDAQRISKNITIAR